MDLLMHLLKLILECLACIRNSYILETQKQNSAFIPGVGNHETLKTRQFDVTNAIKNIM